MYGREEITEKRFSETLRFWRFLVTIAIENGHWCQVRAHMNSKTSWKEDHVYSIPNYAKKNCSALHKLFKALYNILFSDESTCSCITTGGSRPSGSTNRGCQNAKYIIILIQKVLCTQTNIYVELNAFFVKTIYLCALLFLSMYC